MRVRRKSIGGISDTSADVHTATTPGNLSAALVSIDMMRPCAWAERTRRMCNMRGKATSAAKAPRPVTNGRSSRRGTERPTKLMSGPARYANRAQRGADALRRCWKLVDRDAERGKGIVDGVDDRRRRADGAALAQPFGLGDGRWRQRLEMMDFDRWDFPRGRRQIIRQAGRENVAGLVVDDLLEQRIGDALGNAAVDLPVDDHGIDQASGVLGHQKPFDHDAAGLHVHLDHGDVAGIGKRSRWIISPALDDAWS